MNTEFTELEKREKEFHFPENVEQMYSNYTCKSIDLRKLYNDVTSYKEAKGEWVAECGDILRYNVFSISESTYGFTYNLEIEGYNLVTQEYHQPESCSTISNDSTILEGFDFSLVPYIIYLQEEIADAARLAHAERRKNTRNKLESLKFSK